jgi:hypothetical protein
MFYKISQLIRPDKQMKQVLERIKTYTGKENNKINCFIEFLCQIFKSSYVDFWIFDHANVAFFNSDSSKKSVEHNQNDDILNSII